MYRENKFTGANKNGYNFPIKKLNYRAKIFTTVLFINKENNRWVSFPLHTLLLSIKLTAYNCFKVTINSRGLLILRSTATFQRIR